MTLKRSSWLYKYLTFGPLEAFNEPLVSGYAWVNRKRVPYTLTLCCSLFWRTVFATLFYLSMLAMVVVIIALFVLSFKVMMLTILLGIVIFFGVDAVNILDRRSGQQQESLALLGESARSVWKNTVCPIVRIED